MLVWERVNHVRCAVMLLRDMAGAGVVKLLRVSVPSVLVVCFCAGFSFDCEHPHS